MLSRRGLQIAAKQDIPWRFAAGLDSRYDKEKNQNGVVILCYAENNLIQKELQQYIADNVTIPQEALTYAYSTAGGVFNNAMAAHINTFFSPHTPTLPSQVITSTGLTPMHNLLALSLADPGEAILASRPIYGRFEIDFGNVAGLRVIYTDQKNGVDAFEDEIVKCFENKLRECKEGGIQVRAVVIVNPNNPVGRCYPTSTLKAIMQFCEENMLHLISDEVYALSVHSHDAEDLSQFTSVLSFDPEGLISTDRLHVLYGMSKVRYYNIDQHRWIPDFASAGLRLGSLITDNALLRKAIKANMRFCSPSGASVAIGSAILNDTIFVRSFLALSNRRLREAYTRTTKFLDQAGINYMRGNAGVFVFMDLSPWLQINDEDGDQKETLAEQALAQRCLEGGVSIQPREEHFHKPGWFRIVFSCETEVMELGLKRLLSVLEAIERR